jgi:hypothetical protein
LAFNPRWMASSSFNWSGTVDALPVGTLPWNVVLCCPAITVESKSAGPKAAR